MTTVLIVGDEADLAEVMAALLQVRGYRVIVAHDGREGLTKILEERPDVVLTDVMMPVMDGRQMIERMRQDAAMRDVPVIVMSAVDRYGADAARFLRKPFELPDLLRVLEQVTGGSSD